MDNPIDELEQIERFSKAIYSFIEQHVEETEVDPEIVVIGLISAAVAIIASSAKKHGNQAIKEFNDDIDSIQTGINILRNEYEKKLAQEMEEVC